MPADPKTARRWFISGRVQGVGYRYFAQHAATSLNLTGYATNLPDGRVEVYAAGSPDALTEFAGMLRTGPRFSDVRHVEEQEAEVQRHGSFHIR
jgi:acylphosphatase